MITTRNLLASLLLASCLVLLAACSPTADTPDQADTPADDESGDDGATERLERLRLAGGDYGPPTPFAYVRGPGLIQTGLMFDTLLWMNPDGETIPWLAEDWESNEDGTEWTFTLREDVEWHDGEPLTVDDVVFSFDYLTAGPPGISTRDLDIVDEVVAEGDREVVFRLSEPYAGFEDNVAGLWGMFVLPEHIWADVEDPQRYLEEDAFVGSGPYELVEFDASAGSYLYEANDDFFLGEPHVQRLEFLPEIEDELLALERGELHAAGVSREPLPDEQFESFASQFGLVEASGEWNHALHFNLDAGFPYDEVDFRHAVAYAIDRQDMVDRLLFGRGAPGSTGAMAPDHPFTPDDLPAYEHDLERAGELLDGLGIEDADGDGVRELPDGEAFQIDLKSSQRFGARDPQLVAEYLGEAGLDTQVTMLDRASADEAGHEGNYTMMLHGYGGLGSDVDRLRTRFHSEAESSGQSTVHGYADERFDELAEQQRGIVDEQERREVVAEMMHILAEDLPLLSLYVPDRLTFYDESVFDAWAYTPTCTPCGATKNKYTFVTGE
ncbi:MAG: ABC transporter substrate-binding protein [Egibacteraceae bacterium]